MYDAINHPYHYTFSSIEVINAIEAWSLGYHLGCVVKYVARAAHKGTELEDLKKAEWYLRRKIECLEKEQSSLISTGSSISTLVGQAPSQ